jgi:alpha-tubulin suppressor-like RCC1 family protein
MLLIEQLLLRSASASPNKFLYTWGSNIDGQLGTNLPTTDIFSWTAVSSASDGAHTLAIRSDAKLFSWGANGDGQLGLGNFTSRSSPVQVGTSSWTAIAAGGSFSLAIRSDGGLFAWGGNNSGELGLGDYGYSRSSPVQVGTSSWTAVSAGAKHSLAIRSGGSLFAWGFNTSGQLGLDNLTNQSSPVQIGTSSWTAIAAGRYHSLAIRSDGQLFSWGANGNGQCGRIVPGPPALSWTAVSAGSKHTLAIRSDAKLFSWGNNSLGELGTGTYGTNQNSPVQVGTSSWTAIAAGGKHSLAIRSGGSLFAWGYNSSGELGLNTSGYGTNQSSPVQVGTSSWTAVSAGNKHTLAIRSDAKLFSWGNNGSGELGLGDYGYGTNRSSPVQVGTSSWTAVSAGQYHSLAIRSGGSLFAWGNNSLGELGLGDYGYGTNRSSPVQVGTSSWTAVSAGQYHSLAIRSGGSLFAWGGNYWGQLGLGDYGYGTNRSSPVQVGTSSWTAVSAGAKHSLAIRSGGSLFAWGNNETGQLGLNTSGYGTNRSSPVQVGTSSWTAIAAGDAPAGFGSFGNQHSLAIKSDGGLFAWGYNSSGQLGISSDASQSSPVQVGGNPKNELSSISNVGTSSWTAVSAGRQHSLAIRSGGSLFAWGFNGNGQLGLSDTTNRSSPVQIGTSSWTAIAAGSYHSLAIRSDGGLFAWGSNGSGQLGLNIATYQSRSSPVQVGTSSWTAVSAGVSSLAIRSDGGLFAWGFNTSGQLGLGNTTNQSSPVQIGGQANPFSFNLNKVGTSSWTAVSAGSNHTLAIRSDGLLFSWGRNGNGQLGLGNTTNQSSPVQIGTSSWTAVSAGQYHSLAIRSNGSLFAWGSNSGGQLGLNIGTYQSRSSPVQVGTSSWTAVSAGANHTLAIRSGGSLFAWGINETGQLGLNIATYQSRSSPVQVGTSSWTAVSAGTVFSLAIRSDGGLFAWGSNSGGQLGLNIATYQSRISPVQVGTSSWTAVSAGRQHSLAIRSGGSLFAWGSNGNGQLGLSDTTNRSSPVQIGTSSWTAVSAGGSHSLAITSDKGLFSWGNNGYGQLGLGNTTNRSSPVQIGIGTYSAVSAGGSHSATY